MNDPATVPELIAAIEQLFECAPGEVFAYTRDPPSNESRDELPDEQKYWYATFVSLNLSLLWQDLQCAYELAGGARRVAKPKLYWRLADKIQTTSEGFRTRIVIPNLSFNPCRDTWLRTAHYKPEGLSRSVPILEVQS